MNKIYPVRKKMYTLKEIFSDLILRDTPCLLVSKHGDIHPIQLSHLTPDEFLSVPGAPETRWMFLRETEEWIPVFVNLDRSILKSLDFTAEICSITGKLSTDRLWVTPKGFPRVQRSTLIDQFNQPQKD